MMPHGVSLDFLGSATSAFQADPALRGGDGVMHAPSDWEYELRRSLEGYPSHIHGTQTLTSLPSFFTKRDAYLERSAELGENMFRFSLEMGRLCPKPGEFDEAHMAENVKTLALIRARGQEPMVTLNHFTLPMFLTKTGPDGNIVAGGWEDPTVVSRFRFYLKKVAAFLGDRNKVGAALRGTGLPDGLLDRLLDEGLVKYFMSVNEPWTVFGNGYLFGSFLPNRKLRFDLFSPIMERMVDVHDMARDILKELGLKMALPSERQPQVGVGYNWNYLDGWFGGLFHRLVDRKITDKFERNGTYSDFLGLQYYFRMTFPQFERAAREYGDHPNFGDIYPAGIETVLRKMYDAYPSRIGKPIFVTEMGFADQYDLRRPSWILETVRHILAAKAAGVPVKGVLLWSLVSNFEWEQGMEPKFGLFDEAELDRPLSAHKDADRESIRSWEAWAAIIRALRHPSAESAGALDRCYTRARAQHDAAAR